MRIRIIITAILTLAGLFMLPSATASALTTHRCVTPWDQAVQPSGGGVNGWAEADWEGQTCNFTMQVRARCANHLVSVYER